MATKEEKTNFSIAIEKLAIEKNLTYIESISHYCEETSMEIELAATLVNDVLKSKIKAEAQQLRYLPRTSKLPI